MKTAIFLGAGASAAEGAPMQSALFKDFFESFAKSNYRPPNLEKLHKSLTEFFASVFYIRPERQDLKSINFPTFEEALGVLDLSESRGESLRTFGRGAQNPGGGSLDDIFSGDNRVRLVRLYLILSMAKAIADKLQNWRGQPTHPHGDLVRNLDRLKLLSDTVFISTNYDLLMDGALSDHFRRQAAIDYGVEFAGPRDYLEDVKNHPGPRVSLLKIHGSLNWLYCPTCNNLKAFDRKVVMELIDNPRRAMCDYCKLVMSPMIVPPTYYKDMSNVFLSLIWNKAENALREVGHIIFCGYSFPDADMHIKYLLKRAQTNRDQRASLRFTVVNNPRDKPKPPEQKEWEQERYERFLGAKAVTYADEDSFHDFAANPAAFYAGAVKARGKTSTAKAAKKGTRTRKHVAAAKGR